MQLLGTKINEFLEENIFSLNFHTPTYFNFNEIAKETRRVLHVTRARNIIHL